MFFYYLIVTLSPAEAPAGYPYKNSNNRKEKKKEARGGRWEKGKGGSLSSLFLLPIVPRSRSFFFSPASPHHKEASAEERIIVRYS